MSDSRDLTQTWIDVGIVTGVLAGVAYGGPQLPFVRGRVHDLLFMGFGPLLAVAAIGIYHFFRRNRETVSNQLAHLFLFLAGVSFTYMATMQGSIYTLIPRYYHAAEGADTGLAFNFVTFPDNSGEAGLVDPGPFFGVWMTLAAVQVWRCRRWTKEGSPV